jgi:hypothetical protein
VGWQIFFFQRSIKANDLLIVAGADTMLENNKGETVYDYVPNLMEHYKSIYKKLIKDELNYVSTQ